MVLLSTAVQVLCARVCVCLGGGHPVRLKQVGAAVLVCVGGRDGFAGVHPFPALRPLLHRNPEMMIWGRIASPLFLPSFLLVCVFCYYYFVTYYYYFFLCKELFEGSKCISMMVLSYCLVEVSLLCPMSTPISQYSVFCSDCAIQDSWSKVKKAEMWTSHCRYWTTRPASVNQHSASYAHVTFEQWF